MADPPLITPLGELLDGASAEERACARSWTATRGRWRRTAGTC